MTHITAAEFTVAPATQDTDERRRNELAQAEANDQKRTAAVRAIARIRFTLLGSERLGRWLGVRQRILSELGLSNGRDDLLESTAADIRRFRIEHW